MLKMNEIEISEIDELLEPKVQLAKKNQILAEQLAMDTTRLMSCTHERLQDFKDKGFFKRCVSSFSGKTAKMQRDNQNDLISMQQIGWRYLQILNERDILMAHSIITIKNNLETLAIKEDETRGEIARFACKVKDKFDAHSERLDKIEEDIEIRRWVDTIKVDEYNKKYPEHIRLLCLVRDFKSKKSENWNEQDIKYLKTAFDNTGIERKLKLTLKDFVGKLIDEIEETSFDLFTSTAPLNSINITFLLNEVSSPIFNSLCKISEKYIETDDSYEALKDVLKVDKKEAKKMIILRFIEQLGVDINKETQVEDIALEILSCSKLAQNLFEQKQEKEKIHTIVLPKIISNIENISQSKENVPNIIREKDLELSLKIKKFAMGNNFGIFIDSHNALKSFGKNDEGVLGIGSRDCTTHDSPVTVIDLPSDIKCLSLDAGYKHALVLLENGDVYAWGASDKGQLGDNTKDNRLSPFKVIGLPKDIQPVKVLAGAEASLVLLENGDLYATGVIVESLIFVPYKLDFKVKDVEFLFDSTDRGLVLLTGENKLVIKNVETYGSRLNRWCQFDDKNLFYPKGLHEDVIIETIVTGGDYLFVITKNNTLYGIGQNNDGQLGTGERKDFVKTFTKIYGLKGTISKISTSKEAGYRKDTHFTLIMTDCLIYGCGANDDKQLGKYDNYYKKTTETGLIFKDTHSTKYYFEDKVKSIEEFTKHINQNHIFELACNECTSYIYDVTDCKLYMLGKNNDYPRDDVHEKLFS